MLFAVTSDIHLNNKDDNVKYNSLQDIINQIKKEQINNLIIAGDLFDKDILDYSNFEKFCKKNKDVKFIIIPGNHDESLSQSVFTVDNVTVYNETTLNADFNIPILFVPYRNNTSIGYEIEPFSKELPPNNWILIAHSEYKNGSLKVKNQYDDTAYMPLLEKDLIQYRPLFVILGHIHKPVDFKTVYYTGSPIGLDISETGKRRFLIFDTDSKNISSKFINTDFIYFNVNLTILPIYDEEKYLKQQIKQIIDSWDLTDEEKSKTHIKITVTGFTSNREVIKNIVDEEFKNFKKFNETDYSNLKSVSTKGLAFEEIERKIVEYIEQKLEWKWEDIDEPQKNDVILSALSLLYN
jgi:DNA repair exonuclease SbcCD nuclease subunit